MWQRASRRSEENAVSQYHLAMNGPRLAYSWSRAAVLGMLLACQPPSAPATDARAVRDADPRVELSIIHTADEHGWLQPHESGALVYGGVANFKSWLVEEGFDPSTDLLLSGGDNWTGPAISTWLEGEPTGADFNAIGYHAAVIGNHEFDFGREVLGQRIAEANFPFLAANLRYLDSGAQVDFAEPWVIVAVAGVKVGIIGLVGVHTATTAHPQRVADLVFADYANTLAETVPAVRAAGAEVVVVLAHECAGPLASLLESTEVEVDLAYAAHCHSVAIDQVGATPILSSGWGWGVYSVADIVYDRAQGQVLEVDIRQVDVAYSVGTANPVTPDAELLALVASWQAEVDLVLAEEVGYSAGGIADASWAQGNWVTDAWMWAFPSADVAVTNFGGLRQSISAGAVTVEDIVGMMPFDNSIYEVEITGAELVANLEQLVYCEPDICKVAVAGMSYSNTGSSLTVTLSGGAPLDLGATYRVLVNDFLYYGGGGCLYQEHDPTPYDTAQNYRQPVIDWTTSLTTSVSDPLENYIDAAPRG